MPWYKVSAYEVWMQDYEIQANSEEEAQDWVNNNYGTEVGPCVYSGKKVWMEEWGVERLDYPDEDESDDDE